MIPARVIGLVAARPLHPQRATHVFRFRIVDTDGAPAQDFDPEGGVALHEGDLAYEHVHPKDGLADGRLHPGPSAVEVQR